jgi:hypothetical protein
MSFWGKQPHQQFAVEPTAHTLLVVFGQVAQLGERLEPFENQFDLPAEPVPLQDLLGAEFRVW